MVVKQNLQTYPFPTFFLLGSRKDDDDVTDQRLGALIAKQRITAGVAGSEPILQADEPYDPVTLKPIRLESDLVAYKPALDPVVVGLATSDGSVFGDVQVTRNGVASTRLPLVYGWLDRAGDLRIGFAGTNLANFTPDPAAPWKLPTGFDNKYYNGSPQANLGLELHSGDQVTLIKPLSWPLPDRAVSVTIPAAPRLRFVKDKREIPAPVFFTSGVDTVVYLEPSGGGADVFLLTWRFVFAWEARFELVTLEVT